MNANFLISVRIFDFEIGKLRYDANKKSSYFQYNPIFLASNKYQNIFPFIFKKVTQVQVFNQFEGNTFRGLPPMIADSLPDDFGNVIYKKWFDAKKNNSQKILPIELLTYISNRGIGALEFSPDASIASNENINIEEIVSVLKEVLDSKNETIAPKLDDLSLLTIFKIGTSAGGARPKIIVSEHKKTGEIIPGDVVFSNDYDHYLIKLSLDENEVYCKEKVEFVYYQIAKTLNINMMPSKLIDDKHFATIRFDRQNGEKIHVLTASGLTGWDFRTAENSSYENLFKLAVNLKIPHKDLQELFKRMIFNLVFANIDDHLKNHSFIYNKTNDNWGLAPAYDLTYPLNALGNYLRISRALSINNKRERIDFEDITKIANDFSIKNPKKIMQEVQNAVELWQPYCEELNIQNNVIEAIRKEFVIFL